jgi:hypothetical protein
VSTLSTWSWKSSSIEKVRAPSGIEPVVRPRGVTYSVVCHQWLTIGAPASRNLPTI